jgi:hypothetical protein
MRSGDHGHMCARHNSVTILVESMHPHMAVQFVGMVCVLPISTCMATYIHGRMGNELHPSYARRATHMPLSPDCHAHR